MGPAFENIAGKCSRAMGSPWSFLAALVSTALWAASYKLWPTPDAWMLVVNTGTTIITFLAVFLIQNEQNRTQDEQTKNTLAIQVKLDAIIEAMAKADNRYKHIEELSKEEIEKARC